MLAMKEEGSTGGEGDALVSWAKENVELWDRVRWGGESLGDCVGVCGANGV